MLFGYYHPDFQTGKSFVVPALFIKFDKIRPFSQI
jgi:hypothetical protein